MVAGLSGFLETGRFGSRFQAKPGTKAASAEGATGARRKPQKSGRGRNCFVWLRGALRR